MHLTFWSYPNIHYCQFQVPTTFNSLYFFPERQHSKIQNCAKKASQHDSDVLYDLFLFSKWILTCIKQAEMKQFLSLANPNQYGTSWSAMFKKSLRIFSMALADADC